LGDSYASGKGTCFNPGGGANSLGKGRKDAGVHPLNRGNISDLKISGLKPKDLIGIPWRVAFALQGDGWYLRRDIIWEKGNAMCESVNDRCTSSHEYIFHLTKSKKYYYDNEAIKEPSVSTHPSGNGFKRSARVSYQNKDGSARGNDSQWEMAETRNKRSVWHVNTKPYKGAHFATFPPELIEPCIKAGTSEYGVCSECGSPYTRIIEKEKLDLSDEGNFGVNGSNWKTEDKQSSGHRIRRNTEALRHLGRKHDNPFPKKHTVGWQPSCSCNASMVPATVLDPFGGSGTVGQWCQWNNRNAILIELNPEYRKLIEERINTPPKAKKIKENKTKTHEKFAVQQNLTQFLF
jgi:hypothetical protein